MKQKNKVFRAPKNVAKLLVYCHDSRISALHLGRHNIYQRRHYAIINSREAAAIAEDKNFHVNRDAPALVTACYETEEDLNSFLSEKLLRAYRVFKTLWTNDALAEKTFFYNVCTNLLGLLKDKDAVLRISSNDRAIRDFCYGIAVEVSTLFPKQKFDYDEFDVELFLRCFDDHGKTLLVTYVSKGRKFLSV